MADWFRHLHRPKSPPPPQASSSQPFAPDSSRLPSSNVAGHGYETPKLSGPPLSTTLWTDGHRHPTTKAQTSRTGVPQSLNAMGDQLDTEDKEHIWHRPTLEHMLDALYVVMMTNPANTTVPIEYNAYIKHLLEGYSKLRTSLKKVEQKLEEERVSKQRHIDEFLKTADEWEAREGKYKAEIRRMEVLLSKAVPEGVEAVLVARSGSLVDRSLAESRRLRARIRQAGQVVPSGSSDEYADNGPRTSARPQNQMTALKTPGKRLTLGSHRTILTIRPNMDSNADTQLSEQFRHLESGTTDNRRVIMPRDTKAASVICGNEERASPHRVASIHSSSNTDKSSALSQTTLPTIIPGEKGLRVVSTETRTGSHEQLENNGSAFHGAKVCSGPSAKRRHRRDFSFDPGADKLCFANIRDRISNTRGNEGNEGSEGNGSGQSQPDIRWTSEPNDGPIQDREAGTTKIDDHAQMLYIEQEDSARQDDRIGPRKQQSDQSADLQVSRSIPQSPDQENNDDRS